jgi:CHAT domain-containing protein/tetratricopeptide (TPR) repeat protein
MRVTIGIVSALLLCCPQMRANCPDRQQLLARIDFLRQSEISYTDQLNELLPFYDSLRSCAVKNDSVQVFLLQRLGSLSYLTSDFNGAAVYTKKSLDLLASMAPAYTNNPLRIRMYNYLNIFYDSLHRVADKMRAIDSCLQTAFAINAINYEIIYNLLQRVNYGFDIGDYERCVTDAEMGEVLTAKYLSGGDSLSFSTNFFIWRINALLPLGNFEHAEKELQRKLDVFTKAGLFNLCGAFYNQLGHIHINQKKFQAALRDLSYSLKCNKQRKDFLGCRQTLNNIGYLYLHYLNDPQMALRYFRQALHSKTTNPYEEAADQAEAANTMGNIGAAYARLKLFDSSFNSFARAFAYTGNADENSFLQIPSDQFISNPKIEYVLLLIRDKGDAYVSQYKANHDKNSLIKAIGVYLVADLLLERIRAGQAEVQSKLQWRKNARNIYEHAIDACFLAGDTSRAFYFFEKSRAVLLNDQLAMNRVLSNDDQLRRASINYQLTSLNNQLTDSSLTLEKTANIQKAIYSLKREKDLLIETNNVTNWKNDMSLSAHILADVQKKLNKDGRSLLEIFSGDSAVYVFMLTGNKTAFKRISRQSYDSLSTSFIDYLSNYSLLNTRFNDFLQTSNPLNKLLFDDLSLPDGPLIVSPDGRFFPFEALVTNAGSSPRYLIAAHAVSYTYSARFLLHQFTAGDQPAAFFGVAPVTYPSNFALANLTGSDGSLKKLSAFFDSPFNLIGGAATKNAFLNNYASFSIVQLYTHAAEKSDSGDPVIYFADSVLHLGDLIAKQSPLTRMMVLNACETALGKLHEGEGVFSFNRAFAEVGVPSATVNLWSVDDQSSYRLCELFYKFLAQGLPSDIALQKAKLQFMSAMGKEKSLPFYWAAPVLAGQVMVFKSAPHLGADYLMFGIALVIVVAATAIFLPQFRRATYTMSSTG